MSIQIISNSGGTADFSGIFIPATDLRAGGISNVNEFNSSVLTEVKVTKAIYAFLFTVTSSLAALAPVDRLGVTATPPNLNNQAQVFTMSFQRFVKENSDAKLAPLPVASTGNFAGQGDFSLIDLFDNADKFNAGDTIPAAGMLIESAPLAVYGALSHAAIDLEGDCRGLIYSIVRSLALDTDSYPSRSATVASAITARNGGTSSQVAAVAALVDATNPTSGLTAAELPITHILSSGNITLTMDTARTMDTNGNQNWEVNVATVGGTNLATAVAPVQPPAQPPS